MEANTYDTELNSMDNMRLSNNHWIAREEEEAFPAFNKSSDLIITHQLKYRALSFFQVKEVHTKAEEDSNKITSLQIRTSLEIVTELLYLVLIWIHRGTQKDKK